VVNVVTKSGTNQSHGAGWEYIRNSAFDSRGHFLPADQKKPGFHQNQFGASLGGPVPLGKLKNNTFFYFAYQGFRYSLPSSANILVPTDTQLSGDFSARCTAGFTGGVCNNPAQQIYNPFTTAPSGSGFTRTPFANNVIPSALIDDRLVTFMKAIYPAAGPLDTQHNTNGFSSDANTQHQNEYNVRIDHTFGQKDAVWFRYSQIGSNITAPFSGTRTDDCQHPVLDSGRGPTNQQLGPQSAKLFGARIERILRDDEFITYAIVAGQQMG